MVVTAINEKFWQVTVDGAVTGYIDTIDSRAGERYRVRRLRYPSGKWTVIGEWWDFDTAAKVCAEQPTTRGPKSYGMPPQTRWLT